MDTWIDFKAAYKVKGHGGIAWRPIKYHTYRDGDYDWTGEEIVDTTLVDCYMVGDDSVWTFDVDDLTKIDDEEYCSECGQIGCGWG